MFIEEQAGPGSTTPVCGQYLNRMPAPKRGMCHWTRGFIWRNSQHADPLNNRGPDFTDALWSSVRPFPGGYGRHTRVVIVVETG